MLKKTGRHVVFFLSEKGIEFLEEEKKVVLFPSRESAEAYCTRHELQNWHVGSVIEQEPGG